MENTRNTSDLRLLTAAMHAVIDNADHFVNEAYIVVEVLFARIRTTTLIAQWDNTVQNQLFERSTFTATLPNQWVESLKCHSNVWLRTARSEVQWCQMFAGWDTRSETVQKRHQKLQIERREQVKEEYPIVSVAEQPNPQIRRIASAIVRHQAALVHMSRELSIPRSELAHLIYENDYLRQIMDDTRENVLDLVEHAVIGMACAGNVSAATYFLNALGGRRGYGKIEHKEAKSPIINVSPEMTLEQARDAYAETLRAARFIE